MVLVLMVLVVLVIVGVVRTIRVVPQSEAHVVESLGAYKTTWDVGVHFKTPFLDKVVKKVPLKEQLVDFQPTSVITKDNVSITIDSVIFFQITDPKLFTYGVDHPIQAINQLTNTTLRNIFGSLDFDDTLTSRDAINEQAKMVLDAATDPWGIKINRVELKQITPPPDIQDSMERQMKAERERREAILKAEGAKKAAILNAEADKESTLRKAEGEKEAAIMRAEAKKRVVILEAEAEAERRLKEAEAEAQAIRALRDAEAYALNKINTLGLSDTVVRLRSLEALEKVADGKATKLIVPSDLQNIVTLAATAKEGLTATESGAEAVDDFTDDMQM